MSPLPPMPRSEELLLRRFAVGPLQANCYLLGSPAADTALLIDPGDDADRIEAEIEASGKRLGAILLTHAHFDHVGALAQLLERYDVPVHMHPADVPLLEHAARAAASWNLRIRQPQVETIPLEQHQELHMADVRIRCLHTPGHAPGHMAFHLPDQGVVLAGDALFRGSIGRTDLPFGNADELLASIRRELLPLAENTIVLPGHGHSTTIGAEAASNPFLV